MDVGVGPKEPTFFERITRQRCLDGKIFTKFYFLAKCLERSTRIIIHSHIMSS
jgi:hypothetical protein